MTAKLPTDIQVNQEKHQILVVKTFEAPLEMVWDAWTKPEYLDQWWAPRPYRTKTKSMAFEPGGRWHYAMISPENEQHWCLADYTNIENQKSYTYTDAFCDEQGEINPNHPRTIWTVQFGASDEGKTTLVNVTLQYSSLADLEAIVGMGIREGFSMAIGNLDELLLSLINHSK